MLSWRYFSGRGDPLGESERFADRAAAEAWIGGSWLELRDRGIAEVELFDPDVDVAIYRMALADEA